jgi:hypothetical protein
MVKHTQRLLHASVIEDKQAAMTTDRLVEE